MTSINAGAGDDVTDPKNELVPTHQVASWAEFHTFIEGTVFATDAEEQQQTYIWRGQPCGDWSLMSSLDRLFVRLGVSSAASEKTAARHLEEFQYASRGRRRGLSPRDLSENEWWALGQHFGLATPLLDWSRSPFAAAYFAFEDATSRTEYRVVYGLDTNAVRQRNAEIDSGESIESGRAPVLEIIDPMADENPRLVSQGALFTRAPLGMTVESWVAGAFEGTATQPLIRIEIPDAERARCLRALNRMNINHLSLFPDLSGATRYSNLRTELAPHQKSEL
ncbi:MAG TPA: FRG domain-containing protein [Vicinamibacterales bacterium]|nr:FRG domain-containing protein [Vicinamibacterales bacterium]